MEKLLRKNRCKGTGQTGTNQSGKIILQGVIIMFGLFKKKQQITPETGTKRKIVRTFSADCFSSDFAITLTRFEIILHADYLLIETNELVEEDFMQISKSVITCAILFRRLLGFHSACYGIPFHCRRPHLNFLVIFQCFPGGIPCCSQQRTSIKTMV